MVTDPTDRSPVAPASHIVFVGLMGTGKSTMGALLARRLDREFLDNDALLEARTGETAAGLRRDRGEDELHRLEAEVLLDCLASRPFAVIAAAASTILRADVRDALRRDAYVVWLRVDIEVLPARLADPGDRPLSGDIRTTLVRQNHERVALYAAAADVVLETTDKSPTDAAEELLDFLVGAR